MFKTKLSTILLFIICVSIIINIFGYVYLIKSTKNNHLKNEKILFYQIQNSSDQLLSHLLYKYEVNKKMIENKHKEVYSQVLKTNALDKSLESIYENVNKGFKNKPFNIYLTDKNLKIVNTTFQADLGFDLSFAKDKFEQDRKKQIIGVSGPIFETSSSKFYTFTNSYIENTNRLLQTSYRYSNTDEKLNKIQNIIDKNTSITSSNAFILFEDGYVGDFIFKSFKPYKKSLDEIVLRIQAGKKLSNMFEKNSLVIEDVKIDKKKFKNYYFIQESSISNNAKILHVVSFNQASLYKTIKKINIYSLLLCLLLFIVLYFLLKVRTKEKVLSQKDKFIKHSVHEIKTPLSIISLNNQLRMKKQGEDTYTKKIENAVRTLKHSYDDMIFLLSASQIDYKQTPINVRDFLLQRIDYFEDVIYSQGRAISTDIKDEFIFTISEKELLRLIDNNISNSIKYSTVYSTIEIILRKNQVIFLTLGKEIKNKKSIFKKYTREDNKSGGGHGLGLSVVKDICDKYKIDITLEYKDGKNIFIYTFRK